MHLFKTSKTEFGQSCEAENNLAVLHSSRRSNFGVDSGGLSNSLGPTDIFVFLGTHEENISYLVTWRIIVAYRFWLQLLYTLSPLLLSVQIDLCSQDNRFLIILVSSQIFINWVNILLTKSGNRKTLDWVNYSANIVKWVKF